MIQRFFIDKVLSGYNEMIAAAKARTRTKKPVYHGLKLREEKRIFVAIKNAKIRPVEQAKFIFIWSEKNKKRDKDNIAAGKKFIFDSLVSAGILKNDGWSEVICWEEHFLVADGVKYKEGVYVVIEEVTPQTENKNKYERLIYD